MYGLVRIGKLRSGSLGTVLRGEPWKGETMSGMESGLGLGSQVKV
jgi:hypothetical protein